MRQERPVDRFVQATGCRCTAHFAFQRLDRRCGWLGDAVCTGQWHGHDIVEADDTHDFFDNICGAIDVTTPCRHGDAPVVAYGKTQSFQYIALLIRRNIDATKLLAILGVIGNVARRNWCGARPSDGTWRPAAMVEHEFGRDRQSVFQKRRVNAAFKTLPRIAGQSQLLSGARNMFRVEIGALDEDIRRRFRNAAMLATHDTANVMHHAVVSNDGHAGIQRVSLAVEGDHIFPIDRLAGHQRSIQLCAIINVQRPAKIDGYEVGDVDEH